MSRSVAPMRVVPLIIAFTCTPVRCTPMRNTCLLEIHVYQRCMPVSVHLIHLHLRGVPLSLEISHFSTKKKAANKSRSGESHKSQITKNASVDYQERPCGVLFS